VTRVKGILKNVDVYENSKEHSIDNELRQDIAPHLLYECPYCDVIQVHFFKEDKEIYLLKCDDCKKECEVIR
jgi:transcription elongation factor Elf1